ncbi:hypothetical protein ElyMa_001716600 [Elysia marginata]|uniref:Uncharacterized protein n=1 Tax=Elysia marginata TaxID=1093978 RepID=A0AAV4JVD8_9GAST|nr:hypothetical protein ElyMa_001716600 [Elysia marginata]
MTGGLTEPVSQSFAVKPTLPLGIITLSSYARQNSNMYYVNEQYENVAFRYQNGGGSQYKKLYRAMNQCDPNSALLRLLFNLVIVVVVVVCLVVIVVVVVVEVVVVVAVVVVQLICNGYSILI